MGPRPDVAGWPDLARWSEPVEQPCPTQAGVADAAFGVQDLDICPTTRRSISIAGHRDRAPPPDDVPAEPDPARGAELQAEAARLLDRGRQRPPELDRFEQHEQRARPPRERREPAQPVPDPRPRDGRIGAAGQVHDQQVDGPPGKKRARHRERLVERPGHQHDEPLRADATAHGLDGVEGTGEVQPRDDRARGLSLGREPQRERGLARARVPPQRDRRRARQPAGSEDRVECGEPGGDDAAIDVVGGTAGPRRRRGQGRGGPRRGVGDRDRSVWLVVVVGLGRFHRERDERSGESPLGLVRGAPSRSCAAPARLERRERLGNVGCAAHRTSNIRTYVLLSQGSRRVARRLVSDHRRPSSTLGSASRGVVPTPLVGAREHSDPHQWAWCMTPRATAPRP